MRLLLLALFLSVSLVVHAEDWTTSDGKTYQGVKVISHDDGYVSILYSDGGVRIPLRLLNPDLQAHFGYDAKKAAACEAATTAHDHADRDAVEATERASLVQQATGGVPAPAAVATNGASSVAPAPAPPINNETNFGLIQNGDFSRGDAGWHGDGQTLRAYAQANPGAPADLLTGTGLIVSLNPQSWTRIFQTFATDKGTQYSLTVHFQVAPHLALSTNAADYTDISKRINIDGFENFGSVGISPGQFYGTVGDPNSQIIAMEVFSPDLSSSNVQNYQHTYPTISVSESKTVALAFPPGTGIVVIRSVSVTDK
jgi:hypothetical protein